MENPYTGSRETAARTTSTSPFSSPHLSQLPDLVRDSRLETRFRNRYTTHRYYDVGSTPSERPTIREEYWKRENQIGRGSYGCVWLEKCVQGQRNYAIRAVKEIRKPKKLEQHVNYHRELEAMAKFSHPRYVRCFVQSFGWYENADSIFLAMEFIQHGDLHDYMEDSPALPESDVRVIIFQLTEGLSFLHQNGFAHRDLKPKNILVQSKPPETWWVKIGDFGISKRAEEDAAASSTMKGTPGFIAPEIYKFVPLQYCFPKHKLAFSTATGIWALGEIMFQLLAKHPVFSDFPSLMAFSSKQASFPPIFDLCQISDSGNDFLHQVMHAAPVHRLDAVKALDHDWMDSCRAPSPRPASFISQASSGVPDDLWDANPQIVAEPSGRWSTISYSNDKTEKGPQGMASLSVSSQLPNTENTNETRLGSSLSSFCTLEGNGVHSHPSDDKTEIIALPIGTVSASTCVPSTKDAEKLQPENSLSSRRPWQGNISSRSTSTDLALNLRRSRPTPSNAEKTRVVQSKKQRQRAKMDKSAEIKYWQMDRESGRVPDYLVLDVPIEESILAKVDYNLPDECDEFSHCRITLATFQPALLHKPQSYMLRPCLYSKPRKIKFVAFIELEDELYGTKDNFEMKRLLRDTFAAVAHLWKSAAFGDTWKSVMVIVVSSTLNNGLSQVYHPLGLTCDHSEWCLWDKAATAYIQEYTIGLTFELSRHRATGPNKLLHTQSSQENPIQFMDCRNLRSYSSAEDWIRYFADILHFKECICISWDPYNSAHAPSVPQNAIYEHWEKHFGPATKRDIYQLTIVQYKYPLRTRLKALSAYALGGDPVILVLNRGRALGRKDDATSRTQREALALADETRKVSGDRRQVKRQLSQLKYRKERLQARIDRMSDHEAIDAKKTDTLTEMRHVEAEIEDLIAQIENLNEEIDRLEEKEDELRCHKREFDMEKKQREEIKKPLCHKKGECWVCDEYGYHFDPRLAKREE